LPADAGSLPEIPSPPNLAAVAAPGSKIAARARGSVRPHRRWWIIVDYRT